MSNNISFSAIHTFTVVAKELSFTRAAEVLHISPSAVSHQMKLLENQMGVTLFHRRSKGVRLSLAGEALQRHASSGVRDIQHGIVQSQFASQKEQLVIAVIPSLCQLWLMPRLVDFCEKFPQIELELVAIDQLADFSSGQYDGHIHFGAGDYKGCEAKFLRNEKVYPVCHPDLVSETGDARVEMLIKDHKLLLYKAGIEDEPGGISWSDWLRTFSIEKPAQLSQMWFSQVAMALLAAKLKQGIALGWHQMVVDDIASGKLCRLTESEISTAYNYYLVAPNRSWKNSAFNHFSGWLEQQMSLS
ncbi:MAG: LysR family transcriptional regulator [Gammaproteobacteria bacterium]|nr:LysR family transcriptional regulator [Gammaproteobacteria bacterium]